MPSISENESISYSIHVSQKLPLLHVSTQWSHNSGGSRVLYIGERSSLPQNFGQFREIGVNSSFAVEFEVRDRSDGDTERFLTQLSP